MGGLGPTEDDLTRECVGAALEVEVKRDHDLVTAMYKRFAERRMPMPENNAQQADVLVGATVLPNTRGSAPGQWLEVEFDGRPRIVVLLPGPPHELHEIAIGADHLELVGDFVRGGAEDGLKRATIEEFRVRVEFAHREMTACSRQPVAPSYQAISYQYSSTWSGAGEQVNDWAQGSPAELRGELRFAPFRGVGAFYVL